MDNITLKRIDLLHPKLRAEVHTLYAEMCDALRGRAIPRFAYTLRTIKEQNELYQIGRTKTGKIVTNAKGGQSFHNYGLAFDIVLIIDGKEASWDTLKDFDGDGVSDWMECVAIAKKYGFEWGGEWKFKDKPHFQKTFGKSVAELLVAEKIIVDNIQYPKIDELA
jgi:peptidoglycan L-alanyl-D-glutamate endopeptidase CwlK